MSITQAARAKEFVSLLRRRVSDETASHCVFTAEFLCSFAPKAGITNEEAATAGLLHDLCKDMDGGALLSTAQKYGIEPSEVQRRYPGLLHGPVAAEECRRTLGIKDEAIYEAIYWHTTGRAGWGKLGLALYLADFAEPLRRYPGAAEARATLNKEGFRQALLSAVQGKLRHVRTRQDVDPASEAFSAWLETAYDA